MLEIEDRGDFFLTYKANPNSLYTEDDTAKAWLEREQLLEFEVKFLNENFRLPYDVEIVAQECGEANAFYRYDTRQVVVCYELVDDLFETYYFFLEEDENFDEEYVSFYAYDVLVFIFYHEIGHAFIDIYELPITGLEEDVADQFAALMLSFTFDEEGSFDLGQEMLGNVGTWFLLEHAYWTEVYPTLELAAQGAGTPYWGQHSLDIQRFYNIACYAYGADPEYNQFLIDENFLPEDRAITCEREYLQIDYSWSVLLADFDYGFFSWTTHD